MPYTRYKLKTSGTITDESTRCVLFLMNIACSRDFSFYCYCGSNNLAVCCGCKVGEAFQKKNQFTYVTARKLVST
jgi:hypothetical protein